MLQQGQHPWAHNLPKEMLDQKQRIEDQKPPAVRKTTSSHLSPQNPNQPEVQRTWIQ